MWHVSRRETINTGPAIPHKKLRQKGYKLKSCLSYSEFKAGPSNLVKHQLNRKQKEGWEYSKAKYSPSLCKTLVSFPNAAI